MPESKQNSLLFRFLIWRVRHIGDKQFVLMLAGLTGAVAGLAAVILKETVHIIQALLREGSLFEYNYLYLAYPLIGIFLTYLFARYLLREKLGHGVTDVLHAISKRSSIIEQTKMYSRMLTSALTVGFGGSVGLEAPIVVTGSAIGSNVGALVHMPYKTRTLLIGCGAAGAIASIFNSPIAGVIFAIEVVFFEVALSAFIPLLIASVSGSLISMMLGSDDILFSFQLKDAFTAADVPYFVLLGILCGAVSLYFTRATFWVEKRFSRIKKGWKKALLGGLTLGLLIFIFPPIYGEGYDTIKELLSAKGQSAMNDSLFQDWIELKWIVLLFIGLVILVKPFASAITIAAGGSGGIFAPSLFMGGVTGFFLAYFVNLVADQPLVSVSNFTLVGMCGVMSAVLHAPLTAIFLIAEITSGYVLFVPLMLVSAISYTTISYFEKYSIYTKSLIERGDLIPFDKDKQVLRLIDMKKLVETDLMAIDPNATLDDLAELIRQSKRNIFPVVNSQGELKGIVTLDDVREVMFDDQARKSIIIKTIMHSPPEYILESDNMNTVMQKFERTEAWNLPLIEDGKYVGFISKSRIFNAYRKKLQRQHRE